VSAEYVAAMEEVLDLYEAPYDAAHPVVCFDESPKQLIAEVREPVAARPGASARYDVEYQRQGVRDLMMICEPKRGFREVLITERRTKIEFAQSMKRIVDLYPEAQRIRVVLDNLNTHKAASLYEAFAPEEARVIARKLEFHYTPKHGSWLNIAEIELAVLSNMCLAQRIPDEPTLRREVEANVRERNDKAMPVNWRFTTQDARRKLARLYPRVST
jgi:DDE superfamily endonuclease